MIKVAHNNQLTKTIKIKNQIIASLILMMNNHNKKGKLDFYSKHHKVLNISHLIKIYSLITLIIIRIKHSHLNNHKMIKILYKMYLIHKLMDLYHKNHKNQITN